MLSAGHQTPGGIELATLNTADWSDEKNNSNMTVGHGKVCPEPATVWMPCHPEVARAFLQVQGGSREPGTAANSRGSAGDGAEREGGISCRWGTRTIRIPRQQSRQRVAPLAGRAHDAELLGALRTLSRISAVKDAHQTAGLPDNGAKLVLGDRHGRGSAKLRALGLGARSFRGRVVDPLRDGRQVGPGVQPRSVAGELAPAVGQRPLDLAQRLGGAADVLAGGDERVEGASRLTGRTGW
jgi:hypothetical protein